MFPLIWQVCVFTIYVGIIYFLYGVLNSISESYYKVGGWFSLFCFLLAFPMFAYSKEFYPEIATDGDYTILFFLSMFLSFTGAASDYAPPSMTRTIHFVSVSISVVSTFLGLWLQYGIFYPMIGAGITIAIILVIKQKVIWWSEIAAFIWIMIGLADLTVLG